MLHVKKILVPRDFSSFSDQALRHAIDLAARTGAEIHVLFAETIHSDLHVARDPGREVDEILRDRLLKGAEREIADRAIPVHAAVVRDFAPGPAIVRYARENDVDLIIMGTHGRRGVRRLFMGSTAEEVVRTAPCPVLTVHQVGSEAVGLEGINAILVPIDFSSYSHLALKRARELAALYHTRLEVLHVIEEKMNPTFYNTGVMSIFDLIPDINEKSLAELESFFIKSEGPECEVGYHVRYGHPAKEITSFVSEHDIDLVVMGTHGLTGLEHILLGSVAERVVRSSYAPVLTVKGRDDQVRRPTRDTTKATAIKPASKTASRAGL